jgi:hypothetical protein
VSQRFLNLIRGGETAEVAASVEETPSLAESKDAQGVSAFLWSIYSRQPVIRDFLLTRLQALDIFEAAALGDCSRLSALLEQDSSLDAAPSGSRLWRTRSYRFAAGSWR